MLLASNLFLVSRTRRKSLRFLSIEQTTSSTVNFSRKYFEVVHTHDELPRAINVERRFTKAIVGLDYCVESRSGN